MPVCGRRRPVSVTRLVPIWLLAMLLTALPAVPVRAGAVMAAVERLSRFGILTGDTPVAEGAGEYITRAEFATLLARAVGIRDPQPDGPLPFADLAGHPAAPYVAAVVERGYMTGHADGTFRPDGEIRYTEVVTVLVRLSGLRPDADKPWPQDHVDVAMRWGIIPAWLEFTPYQRAPAVRGAVWVLLDHAMRTVRDAGGLTLYQRIYDPEPPELVVDPVPRETAARRIRVTGVARGAVRVRVAAVPVPLDAGGRFEAYVDLEPGLNGFMVEAEDDVGNRRVLQFPVTLVPAADGAAAGDGDG